MKDTAKRDVVEVARFHELSRVQLWWRGDVLEVRSFTFTHLVPQSQTASLAPCTESLRPLLCLMNTRQLYERCAEDAHCESQHCRGLCVQASTGEACSSDEGCDGACVAQICRDRDEGICDSDADCQSRGFCLRNPAMMVGRCYWGDEGDPCEKPEHCSASHLCEGITLHGAGVCTRDPNAVIF